MLVVLDHHVARCFQRRAVDHDVAADQQSCAGERQRPVGGDELVGRCPATVGQMLAGRGLCDPIWQRDAAAQGKWLGQRIAPVTCSVLIHLTPPSVFVYVVHVHRIVKHIHSIVVNGGVKLWQSYQVRLGLPRGELGP